MSDFSGGERGGGSESGDDDSRASGSGGNSGSYGGDCRGCIVEYRRSGSTGPGVAAGGETSPTHGGNNGDDRGREDNANSGGGCGKRKRSEGDEREVTRADDDSDRHDDSGSSSSSGGRGGSTGNGPMCPTSECEGASNGLTGGASESRDHDGDVRPCSMCQLGTATTEQQGEGAQHAAHARTEDITQELGLPPTAAEASGRMADLDASVMGRDSGECATRHDATFTEYAELAKCGTRIELAKGVETEESVAEIARCNSSGNGGATKKRRRNGNKGNAHQMYDQEPAKRDKAVQRTGTCMLRVAAGLS